jgi:hypothetical protein
MVRAALQRTGRSVAGAAVIAASLLLGACAGPENSHFVTASEGVQLHSLFSENGPVSAVLPRGTPVERLGTISSSCECWLVSTPAGAGWVYTRYLELQMADLED